MAFAHHHASLGALRALFSSLSVPGVGLLSGSYRATFVGPAWLRASATPSLAVAGLPGWAGKRFLAPDRAVNLLRRDGQLVEALTMAVVAGASRVDGQPGLALLYGPTAPRPWRWVRDELRAVDQDTVLGMTVVDVPLLRALAFPFLLEREA
jgi:hypothetical protein